ncbi:cobalamin biosynthesis protein [uncultured Methylobacterium sp.]|uniref:cobalamin biosynthesis protein n=1 Tax=uncultured Methylobacterium sp. TaxID=157278 RepID=UPI0035CA0AA5
MDLDQAVSMFVAGVGFRRATDADEIVALVHQALDAVGIGADRLRALATASDKADDEALRRAADLFGVVVIAVAEPDLVAVDARVPTRSARIEASRGIGSLAEAAALAAVGEGGRLVLPRIASAGATCALALPSVCGQSPTP